MSKPRGRRSRRISRLINRSVKRIRSRNPPPVGGLGFSRLSRMESLETRRLLALSASIDSMGVLVVSQDATAQDDALTIEFDASLFSGNGGVRLTASTLNGGSPQTFDAALFHSIDVNTGSEANDTVDVPSSSDPFTGAGALGSFTITTGQIDINESIEVGSELSLTLSSSSQSNLTSPISGAGGFAMDAQGTVRLLAVHSYAGPTTVTAGTLELFEENQLPSGTAAKINGTLVVSPEQVIGSLTGSGSVVVLDPLTIGGNGLSTTFAGVLSGLGNVVKTGPETLTLSGDNTYTGMTMIMGGTLHVTGRIGGSAVPARDVTIANSATLSGGGDAALGQGIVNAPIDGAAGSTIRATDDFVLGSDTANILRTFGTLDVNGHTVTLKFSGIAFVTGSGAAVDLGGGVIIAGGNGLHVGSGATLTGAGMVEGLVTIQNDARLDPGSSSDIVTVGQLLLERGGALADHGSSVVVRVDGGVGAGQTGGHSQVIVDAALDGAAGGDGTVDLDNFGLTGAALELTLADLSGSLVGGESLVILDNDGTDPVVGIFRRLLVNGIDQGTRVIDEGYVISNDFGGSGLTATITYQGGDGNDVAINVIAPSANLPASGGSYELVYDSATGDVVVREVGTSNEFFRMAAGSFPSLQINGAANASDALTIQLSPTSPIPSGGITFDGGAGGSDGLAVVGGGTDTAVYTPDAGTTGDGTIDVNGTGTITFTGLEPIDISGMLNASLILPLTGANDTLTIANGSDFFAGGTSDALRVGGTTGDSAKGAGDGTPIETVAFFNNTSVFIDTTQLDGDDLITINGANNSHDNATLSINAGIGDDDVNISGDLTVSGNLNVAASQVTQLAGTIGVQGLLISGNLTLRGDALHITGPSSSVSGTTTIGDSDGMADTITLQGNLSVGPLTVREGDTFDLQGAFFNAFGPTIIEDDATLGITSSGAQTTWNNVVISGTGTLQMVGIDGTITFSPGSTLALGDGDGQSATVNVQGLTPGGIVLQAPGSLSSDQPDWMIVDNAADANSLAFSNVNVFDSDAGGGKTIRTQGTSILTRTINWQPPNSPPQAVAGGPYDVFEREDLLLDAGGSTDPDACCGDTIVEFAWDLDNDGVFTDHVATTPQTTVPWATLDSLTLPVDVPLTIQLRVTDQVGALTSVDLTTLTINPSEPLPGIVVTPPGTIACNVPLSFDSSTSTHSSANRSIAFYEWDFDYDGTFDVDATGPTATHTYFSFGTHQTALRVTDDDPIEPQVRIATTITDVDFNNVAPIALAGGSYTSTVLSGVPQPILLDASGSIDANVPCDDIVRFDWDLDGDGQYGADDTDGVNGNASLAEPVGATASFVDPSWTAGQTFTIALRVTDGFGAEAFDTTTVEVVLPPLPPVADAGGPYVIGPSQGVTLDGSGSSDPNECCGDSIVEYAWDLDADGLFGETENGQTEPIVSTAAVMVTDAILGAFGINQAAVPFTVRLRVIDGDGLTGDSTTTLTIFDEQPVASFTADPNPASCNQSVTFDASGSFHQFPGRSIVSYAWDFDDDGQFDDASGLTAQAAFGQFGAHPVRLQVTDDNPSPRTNIAELVVDVNRGNDPPIANSGGPYVLDVGSDLLLDAGGSSDPDAACGDSIATYAWDIDDDGADDVSTTSSTLVVPWLDLTSLVQFPTNPMTGLPSNPLRLTVTDTLGSTSSSTTTLTIFDNRPVPVVGTLPEPAVVASGEVIQFDGNGSFHGHADHDIVEWRWDFDASDGLSFEGISPQPDAMGPVVTHTYSSFGTFVVTLQVTDDNTPPRQETTTVAVTVNSPPVADAGGPYFAGAGEEVVLDAGPSSDPDACCGDVLTYQWDLDFDGQYGETQNGQTEPSTTSPAITIPHVVLDAFGLNQLGQTYDLRLRVTDGFGETDEATTELTILANEPVSAFSADPNPAACNETITFDATSSFHTFPGRSIVSFEWDFDADGQFDDASGEIVQHAFGTFGSFPVRLRVTDDNTPARTDVAEVPIDVMIVNDPPQADHGGPYVTTIDSDVDLVLVASGSSDPDDGCGDEIVNYQWDLDGDGTDDFSTPNSTLTVRWEELQSIPGIQFPANPSTGLPHNTVRLTVTDSFGESSTATTTLTIFNDQPQAVIDTTPNPPVVELGQPVLFDASASFHGHPDKSILEYAWDFEDDGTIDDQGPQVSHVYSQFGAFTVRLIVTDDNVPPRQDTDTVTILVNSPLEVDAGDDQSATEGELVSLAAATFHDASAIDTHTATIDWGDGSPIEPGMVSEGPSGSMAGVDGTVNANHFYADDGTYTVIVCVADDEEVSCDTFTVTVENALPEIVTLPDQTVEEGELLQLPSGMLTDQGTLDTHTGSIDWRDGTATKAVILLPGQVVQAGTKTVREALVEFPTHVYADEVDVPFSVRVCIVDDNFGMSCNEFEVTVSNVAPEVDAGPDQSALEGELLVLPAASFNDRGTLDTHTATIDWGDGSPAEPGTVSEIPFGPPGSTDGLEGTVTFPSHAYANGGTYTVTVCVIDDDAAEACDTLTAEIGGRLPVVAAGLDQSASEGQTVNFAGSFTDASSGDTLTIEWDFGDGSPSVRGTLTPMHDYADNGSYIVTLTVTDNSGGSASDTLTVDVRNLPPSIGSLQLTPSVIPQFGPSTLTGEFSDPGSADSHVVDIDWNGDGVFDDVSLPVTGGEFAFGHTFDLSPGLYPVFVRLRDNGGGVTTAARSYEITAEEASVRGVDLFYNDSVFDQVRPTLITGAGGGPHVKVFDGTGRAELTEFFAFDSGFTGGVRVAAGDVNGDGVADIITGAGAGGGPHVRVFSGSDQRIILADFLAFDPSFNGGVFVASGDINGDGRADIIAGAGVGGGPHVKVFDGRSGIELRSFFAFDAAFTGGVRVAAGDVNGDGLADIITGAGAGSGPHVRVFSGADGNPLLADFFAFTPIYTGGVNVAMADVNSDGFDDIIVGADVGVSHVRIIDGQGATELSGDVADAAELQSFFAFDPAFLGGVRVAAGDVNGDGRADIITAAGPGGGPHVRVFDGSDASVVLSDFFAFDPTFTGGVFVAAAVPPRDGPSDAIADQLAIDLSKSPLRFGQAATFESVSSFVHGINGLVVDLKGAPADGAQIDAGDFMFMVGNDNMPDTWQPGPAPDRIVVLPNAGVDGSDRTLIEFPNGAIVDTWLRITVKANADTGLAADEDFFYGNVRGDTGAAFVGVGEFFGRGARDFQSVALELFHRVGVGNPNDVDGNGIVDAFDLQAIATASGGGVNLRVIEAITPQPAALDAAAVRAVAAPPMPSPLVETDRAAPLPRAARDTAKDAAFGQMGISQNGGISFETRRTSAETPDSLAHLRAELGSDLPLATAIRTDPRDLALQLFAPI